MMTERLSVSRLLSICTRSIGQDPNTFEAWSGKHWWTRPGFGKVKQSVTDVSAMSLDMLVMHSHFTPLNYRSGSPTLNIVT